VKQAQIEHFITELFKIVPRRLLPTRQHRPGGGGSPQTIGERLRMLTTLHGNWKRAAAIVLSEAGEGFYNETLWADRVLEFKERLDGFALLRAGALTEGTITHWRFDNGLLLRLRFHAPNLIVEHGSQRQQVAVSWYSPYPPIVRPHLHCPTCDRGCYALYEVGGIFTCRICGQLDYACRHIN